MKRIVIVMLVLFCGLCLAGNALAGGKEAAKKNVAEVVAAINGGKDVKTINANDYDPYVFILEEDGMLVVHPSLAGKSLKEAAPPVYEAIAAAVKEGKETADYMWQGAMKHSYVQKTNNNLIVGSGYSE
ncbi:MAG: cache domain-containing protein [Desulfobacterales bacterium]|nr:cache domain-containing protein [Desulfobacterales bacterium]